MFSIKEIEEQFKGEMDGFGLVKDGTYTVQIVNSETKDTRDGTGKYLKLDFQVLGPEFAGRRIFENLNFKNKNRTAEVIANRKLKAILQACGLTEVSDSAELHNIPFEVKIGTRPAEGAYEAQNIIKDILVPQKQEEAPVVALRDDEIAF